MNHNTYTSVAAVYDRLNASFDYAAYTDYLEKQFGLYCRIKPESVLDLACGTGTVTRLLAGRGYDMIGVDLSEEMLAVARKKCENEHFRHPILFVRQNMADLELYGTVDAAVCCLDSLNYLCDTASLARTFAHVHNYLNPDGLFLFDMNAPAKFKKTYADNAYILEEDGILCAWQNEYHEKTKLCDFYLSLFTEKKDGSWERFDEWQRERCYSLKTVRRLLTENGFEILSILSDDRESPAGEETERWYVTARAIKEGK